MSFAQMEHQLEAVLLVKFTNFVTWPKESNIDDITKPFIITVIGNSPIKEHLKNIFEQKEEKIKNKKVNLNFIKKIEEVEECDVLFISKNTKEHIKEILKITNEKPLLTVSDSKGYGEAGVLINFYVAEESKLRFEINYKKVKESKISINSRLLKNAKIVGGEI
jgi:hypothetical protein